MLIEFRNVARDLYLNNCAERLPSRMAVSFIAMCAAVTIATMVGVSPSWADDKAGDPPLVLYPEDGTLITDIEKPPAENRQQPCDECVCPSDCADQSENPVRYSTGELVLSQNHLDVPMGSRMFGHQLVYRHQNNNGESGNPLGGHVGSNWFVQQWAQLSQIDGNLYAVQIPGGGDYWFELTGSGSTLNFGAATPNVDGIRLELLDLDGVGGKEVACLYNDHQLRRTYFDTNGIETSEETGVLLWCESDADGSRVAMSYGATGTNGTVGLPYMMRRTYPGSSTSVEHNIIYTYETVTVDSNSIEQLSKVVLEVSDSSGSNETTIRTVPNGFDLDYGTRGRRMAH